MGSLRQRSEPRRYELCTRNNITKTMNHGDSETATLVNKIADNSVANAEYYRSYFLQYGTNLPFTFSLSNLLFSGLAITDLFLLLLLLGIA